MKTAKLPVLLFLIFSFCAPATFAFTAIEESSEDIYWTDPMTVHDYEKDGDIHNIAISTLALTELEIVKLGDGLINFTLRSNKSPISKSLDSLQYAYSKLPRIYPVKRLGQLFDALQLRQLSLSDGRIVTSILFFDGYGAIAPMMQVRVYKLFIFVEDIIDDIDSAVMFPVNWSVSSLRDKPTKIKTIGYLADGLGIFRWELSRFLKFVGHKMIHLGSDIIFGVEKIQNGLIRRKKKKQSADLIIYSKMPLSVFRENQSYFENEEGTVTLGTVADWHEQIFYDPELLPEDIQTIDLRPEKIITSQDASQQVIVASEYKVWDKTPRELRQYVIAPDEFKELVQQYDPLSFSGPALVENT